MHVCRFPAWALGVWLADGSAGAPRLDKIGVDLSRAELILRLDEWCAGIAGVSPAATSRAALRGKGRSVKLGPVFERLLQSYGLAKEKHFPAGQIFIADSSARLRRALEARNGDSLSLALSLCLSL